MKKYLGVVLGLALIVTSCGTETKEEPVKAEATENAEQENSTEQEEKQTVLYKYEVTEVGEFKARLDRSYDGVTVFAADGDKDLYGALDSDGNVIIEPQYDYLSYGDGVFTISNTTEDYSYYYTYANLDGKTIIENVEGVAIIDAQDFEKGLALVTLEDDFGAGRYLGDYTYAIDKTGKIVISATSENSSLYFNEDKDLMFEYNRDGEIVNIYNLDGTKASEEVFNEENYNGDNIYEVDGIYYIKDTTDTVNDSYAIYDNESKTALTEYIYLYSAPEKLGNNYLVYKVTDSETGYNYVIIDNKGNEVYQVSENYNEISYPEVFNDKLILNFVNDKAIVLDENGNVYKETNYDMIYGSYGEETVGCMLDNQVGYLDADFNEMVEPKYDEFTNINNGKGFVVSDGVIYKVEIIK